MLSEFQNVKYAIGNIHTTENNVCHPLGGRTYSPGPGWIMQGEVALRGLLPLAVLGAHLAAWPKGFIREAGEGPEVAMSWNPGGRSVSGWRWSTALGAVEETGTVSVEECLPD